MAQALFFLQGVTGSYGLAIILLTIGVRVLLLPLTVKQVRSMKKMQHLQPKIKEIQKKHKDDKKKQQEEQMKLITEHGFNPLGGCLPLILQMPVFFALFSVLRHRTPAQLKENATTMPILYKLGIAMSKATFFGIHLGVPMQELVKQLGKSITYVGLIPNVFLIIAMIASQFFYSKAMGSGDQSQAKMMNIMLLMMGYFAYILPAGLVLYWITTNVVGILEHYLIDRFTPGPEPTKQGA